MLSLRCWSRFRRLRVTVFGLCATLNLATVALVIFYLVKEWKSYITTQKIAVAMDGGVHLLSGLLVILLLFVSFHPKVDFAYILASLALQSVANFFVTKNYAKFPCVGLGSSLRCRAITRDFIIGSWALSGLFLGYLVCLGTMICFAPSPSLLEVSQKPSLSKRSPHGKDEGGREKYGLASNSEKHATVASFFPRECDDSFRPSATKAPPVAYFGPPTVERPRPSSTRAGSLQSSAFDLNVQEPSSIASSMRESRGDFGGIMLNYSFLVPEGKDSSRARNTYAGSGIASIRDRHPPQKPESTFQRSNRPLAAVPPSELYRKGSQLSRVASTASMYSVESTVSDYHQSKPKENPTRNNSQKSGRGLLGGKGPGSGLDKTINHPSTYSESARAATEENPDVYTNLGIIGEELRESVSFAF